MLKLLKLLEAVESPESATEFINEITTSYKPVVYGITGEFFRMYMDLNKNDEYFSEKAKRKQKYLDAYIAAGFTREEAILFLLDSDLRKERALSLFMPTAAQVPSSNA